MVDDVQDNLEPNQHKGGGVDAAERARVMRERREAEQRRRLDELRAHAAAAQAQREQRDAERRRRADDQRQREDERRNQVEERKRAIWEAGVSRREALLRRDREREERLERQRAARSAPRTNVFAFGSSTPRMLEPADTGGIFWGHRSTNPLDQMSFFESLQASSTSNVMFTSAPLTRRSSTFDLDRNDRDKKVIRRYTNSNEVCDQIAPTVMWSSVARRRTDLVPTIPAPRPPDLRSGETTPGSRPGSAMSQSTVTRRTASTPRRPRPASIAGTPRGAEGLSVESTPTVSRDATSTNMATVSAPNTGGEVVRRPQSARRARPVSMHVTPTTPVAPGDGKPPLYRKPKLPKEQEKTPSRTSGRVTAESSKEPTPARDIKISKPPPREQKQSEIPKESNQVNAAEVTQKLEALQQQSKEDDVQRVQPAKQPSPEEQKPQVVNEVVKTAETLKEVEPQNASEPMQIETTKPVKASKPETPRPEPQKIDTPRSESKKDEKTSASQEKAEESDMTASMIARRITTEEEAKAALAERRRKAREEFERQAELERQRLVAEAAAEAERQTQEEERQRQLEEEARELAELQRSNEEEKLRKAIEAQQQLEKETREKAAREEEERIARQKEEAEALKQKEVAEAARREEAEREEAERRERKKRVEAIMLRTRQKKAEEDKKAQEAKDAAAQDRPDNGNTNTADLLGITNTADLLGITNTAIQSTIDLLQAETNSNVQGSTPQSVDLLSSDMDLLNIGSNVSKDSQSNVDLLAEVKSNGEAKEENGYTIHNGHKENNGLENVLNSGSQLLNAV